jgi:predicted GIY-YIG superfamily endonuclease
MGYENSKVYKLQCVSGHFYIGSTSNTLAKRLGQHKAKALIRPECRVYKHINGEWNQVRIVLIEAFPCESKEQLNKKEDEYIQKELNNLLCLNSKGATFDEDRRAEQNARFDAEYQARHYQENKATYKANARAYYLAHREERIQANRDYRAKKNLAPS